jgi:hypothetical protein
MSNGGREEKGKGKKEEVRRSVAPFGMDAKRRGLVF